MGFFRALSPCWGHGDSYSPPATRCTCSEPLFSLSLVPPASSKHALGQRGGYGAQRAHTRNRHHSQDHGGHAGAHPPPGLSTSCALAVAQR